MTDSPAPDLPAFTPVPSASSRHDGWTPERQARFLAVLAAGGVVAAAARAVGKSATSAYRLRERAGADSFAAAWDLVQAMAAESALERAMDQAMHGVEVPLLYRGRQVATVRRFDNRLAFKLLDRMATRPDPAVDYEAALAAIAAQPDEKADRA